MYVSNFRVSSSLSRLCPMIESTCLLWSLLFNSPWNSLFVRETAHSRRGLLISCFLKESGDVRRKRRGQWGVRMGWKTWQGQRPGHALHLTRMQLNISLFFWSWKQNTCWRPEDSSSPCVSIPLSPRYHFICVRKASGVSLSLHSPSFL